jgi:hypothetical protein
MTIKRDEMGQIIRKRFKIAEIKRCLFDGTGMCVSCGSEQDCDQDARDVRCEACGRNDVYGASELLTLGCVDA